MYRPRWKQKTSQKCAGNNNSPVYATLCPDGFDMQDLDVLTTGMVEEMVIESQNDSHPYKQLASQQNMDKF